MKPYIMGHSDQVISEPPGRNPLGAPTKPGRAFPQCNGDGFGDGHEASPPPRFDSALDFHYENSHKVLRKIP